jgi:hypothetical protein
MGQLRSLWRMTGRCERVVQFFVFFFFFESIYIPRVVQFVSRPLCLHLIGLFCRLSDCQTNCAAIGLLFNQGELSRPPDKPVT